MANKIFPGRLDYDPKYAELLMAVKKPVLPDPFIKAEPKQLLGRPDFVKSPFTFNPPGWETWAETNHYAYDGITRIEINAQHPTLGIGPLRVVYELVDDPFERDNLRVEAVNQLWQLMIAEEATSRGLV